MWTSLWSFSRGCLEAEPPDPPNIFLCSALTVLALEGLRRTFQRGASIAMPYAIALFFFPMVYYVTHPQDYYRRPMDPICVVLAVYTVTSWIENRTRPALRHATFRLLPVMCSERLATDTAPSRLSPRSHE